MNISDDVMEVLSTIETQGNEARIKTQLDRKLYTKTNKVLAALGGKWTRKVQAHVFPGDAGALIESVLLTGEVTTHQDIGFFPTPIDIGRKLVEEADIREGNLVLEPSAGRGDLVAAIIERHTKVSIIAVEREERFAEEIRQRFPTQVEVHCGDFIASAGAFAAIGGAGTIDRVIMNPPFIRENGVDHLTHVETAHELLGRGGRLVTVLPKGIDFRMDARHRGFREWFQDHDGFTRDLPDQAFKASGTGVRTVMLSMGA